MARLKASKKEILAFSEAIEEIVYMKDIPYMEAILLHCKAVDIEPELAANLITDTIKAKLADEVSAVHLLPKVSKLPL